MKKFVFRFEMQSDERHLPMIMQYMGIEKWDDVSLGNIDIPFIPQNQHVFESEDDIETVRVKLYSIVSTLFIDLHRVYETLQEGDNIVKDWCDIDNTYLYDISEDVIEKVVVQLNPKQYFQEIKIEDKVDLGNYLDMCNTMYGILIRYRLQDDAVEAFHTLTDARFDVSRRGVMRAEAVTNQDVLHVLYVSRFKQNFK